MKKGKHGGEGDSWMGRTREEKEDESSWMKGAGVRRRGGEQRDGGAQRSLLS